MESIDWPMAPSCPLTELKAAAPLFDFVQIDNDRYEATLIGKEVAQVSYFGEYKITTWGYKARASKAEVNAKLMECAAVDRRMYWTREELVDAVQAFKAALEVYSCAWPYLHRLVPPQLTFDYYDGPGYIDFTDDDSHKFDGVIGCVDERVNAIVTHHMSIVDAIWEMLPLPIAEAVTEEFLVHVEIGKTIRRYDGDYDAVTKIYPVIDRATGAEILRAESPEEWLEPLKNYRAGVSNYVPPVDRIICAVDNFSDDCAALRKRCTWRDRDGRGVLDHFPPVISTKTVRPRPLVNDTYMALDQYCAERF